MSEQPARDESVTDINMKFENGPNVLKIKENHPGHFNFSAVKLKDVNRTINSLDPSKTIQQDYTPVKIKQTVLFLLIYCA